MKIHHNLIVVILTFAGLNIYHYGHDHFYWRWMAIIFVIAGIVLWQKWNTVPIDDEIKTHVRDIKKILRIN